MTFIPSPRELVTYSGHHLFSSLLIPNSWSYSLLYLLEQNTLSTVPVQIWSISFCHPHRILLFHWCGVLIEWSSAQTRTGNNLILKVVTMVPIIYWLFPKKGLAYWLHSSLGSNWSLYSYIHCTPPFLDYYSFCFFRVIYPLEKKQWTTPQLLLFHYRKFTSLFLHILSTELSIPEVLFA